MNHKHDACKSIETECDHIIISQRDIPQYQNVVKFVKSTFDIPRYDNCVIFVHYPIPWTRVESEYRLRYPNKKFIFYNFEPLVEGNPWFNIWDYMGVLHTFDEIWSYTSMSTEKLWTCRRLMEEGKKAKFKPIIANSAWEGLIPKSDEDRYDIGFVGSMSPHRATMLHKLCSKIGYDYSFKMALGVEGEKYYRFLGQCKSYLHIHGGTHIDQEVERISFLTQNAIPIVSEVTNPNYFDGLIDEFRNLHGLEHKIDRAIDPSYGLELKEKFDRISNNLRELIISDQEIPTENFKYINYL